MSLFIYCVSAVLSFVMYFISSSLVSFVRWLVLSFTICLCIPLFRYLYMSSFSVMYVCRLFLIFVISVCVRFYMFVFCS